MTWAQRLKRVFNIDIETCNNCGGNVKIVACIEDPEVIEKILIYLERKDTQLLSRVCHRLEGRAGQFVRLTQHTTTVKGSRLRY